MRFFKLVRYCICRHGNTGRTDGYRQRRFHASNDNKCISCRVNKMAGREYTSFVSKCRITLALEVALFNKPMVSIFHSPNLERCRSKDENRISRKRISSSAESCDDSSVKPTRRQKEFVYANLFCFHTLGQLHLAFCRTTYPLCRCKALSRHPTPRRHALQPSGG